MPVDDNHPAFTAPDDADVQIWRYMDFTKFVSMLDRRSLFFPSMEVLAKADPFEGSPPKLYMLSLDVSEIPLDKVRSMGFKTHDDMLQSQIDSIRRLHRMMRRLTYINCWHMNEHESAAMWSIYCGGAPGIAIVSTYAKLKEALSVSDNTIYIGKVVYIDYIKDRIPEDNIFYTAMHKRKSFEHERELRAIIANLREEILKEQSNPDNDDNPSGTYVECDLELLIQKVVVSPFAPTWYEELVTAVIKKYDYSLQSRQSDLIADPFF